MIRLHRRVLLRAALGSLLCAATALPTIGALAESGDDARDFINSLAEKAITNVADAQISEVERAERFRKLFSESFSIPDISRFVLSRYWKVATPEQQQEFVHLFEDVTVLTWARRFRDYKGEKLEVLSAAKEGEHGWTVDSKIQKQQPPAVPVRWKLRETPNGLRIIDIAVQGVSLAITHRDDFNAQMQANEGNFDTLLSNLRTKIDQLKAAG